MQMPVMAKGVFIARFIAPAMPSVKGALYLAGTRRFRCVNATLLRIDSILLNMSGKLAVNGTELPLAEHLFGKFEHHL